MSRETAVEPVSAARYEKRLLLILTMMFGIVFFDRTATNYLGPFIAADLKLSNSQLGLLAASLSVTWAISGYLGGAFSDRTGKRKSLLVIFGALISALCFLSGLATSFAALIAARLLMGLAEGPVLPISQALIVLASNERRRGMNMGIVQNFGANLLGTFMAPIILVALASAYGWRTAFYCAALPGFLLTAIIFAKVREPQAADSPAITVPAPTPQSMASWKMLSFRNMQVCLPISSLMIGWLLLNWVFLPVYYVRVRHVSPHQMSLLMGALGLSACLASIAVPGLSDRVGRKPVMIAFTLLGGVTPLAVVYFQGPLIWLGALVFLGWLASGTFPLFLATIPSETIPIAFLARSLGLVMGTGEIAGGVGGPYFGGLAADHFGLRAPLMMAAAFAAGACMLALLLQETAPSQTAPR